MQTETANPTCTQRGLTAQFTYKSKTHLGLLVVQGTVTNILAIYPNTKINYSGLNGHPKHLESAQVHGFETIWSCGATTGQFLLRHSGH